MGRELRMVPPGREHPRNDRGNLIGQYKGSYREAAEQWLKDLAEFEPNEDAQYFWEWDGGPPERDHYMYNEPPDPATLTHFQMFEDTSEGTPISPIFETKEELCRWLVDNNASAFGHMTASYEDWMATCNRGWAPSMVLTPGQEPVSGVEALAGDERAKR